MTMTCQTQDPTALGILDISILGAHSCEIRGTKCISFLVNNKVAIDAGGLTSSLSTEEQSQLKAILLTHAHYDHIKDIPILALNLFRLGASIEVYGSLDVCNAITTHFLNGTIYPDFQNLPREKPTVRFNIIEPYKPYKIEGLDILALPANHPVDSFGYQISNNEGKSCFYTSDTGSGLSTCWKHISPDLILADLTLPNSYSDFAVKTGHLTPNLLENELLRFRELKGYSPRVVVVHTDPTLEGIIEEEVKATSVVSNMRLEMAYEGMQIRL
jgi:phosphoribosyl 1,2-cyclic phosphodiesterase